MSIMINKIKIAGMILVCAFMVGCAGQKLNPVDMSAVQGTTINLAKSEKEKPTYRQLGYEHIMQLNEAESRIKFAEKEKQRIVKVQREESNFPRVEEAYLKREAEFAKIEKEQKNFLRKVAKKIKKYSKNNPTSVISAALKKANIPLSTGDLVYGGLEGVYKDNGAFDYDAENSDYKVGDTVFINPNSIPMKPPFEEPEKSYITSGFQTKRLHPIKKIWKEHLAVDVKVRATVDEEGRIIRPDVVTPADGIVEYSKYANKGDGNKVKIVHGTFNDNGDFQPNGFVTTYSHLHTLPLKPNQIVYAGDVVGKQGRTGLATGDHVHYVVNFNGIALNAKKFWDMAKENVNETALAGIIRKVFPSGKCQISFPTHKMTIAMDNEAIVGIGKTGDLYTNLKRSRMEEERIFVATLEGMNGEIEEVEPKHTR